MSRMNSIVSPFFFEKPRRQLVSFFVGDRIKWGSVEPRDGLEVMGIWEEIEELEAMDTEAEPSQPRRIAPEGGGVARDVAQVSERTLTESLAELAR